MRDLELGFEKERVITIPSRQGNGTHQKFEVLKGRLEQLSGVSAVTLSLAVPGKEMWNNVVRLGWDESADWSDMRYITVDYDFIPFYGLEMVAGRAFDESFGSDLNEAFILNESGVNRLGYANAEEAIGKRLFWNGRKGRVIGVLKDFYFMSVQNEVEPFIMPMIQERGGYLSVKVQTDNFKQVVGRITAAYNEVLPDRIFEYAFLDEDFDRQYAAEEKFSNVFTFFRNHRHYDCLSGPLWLGRLYGAAKSKGNWYPKSVRLFGGRGYSFAFQRFLSNWF